MASDNLEKAACELAKLDASNFNPNCDLPYGLKVEHVQEAMQGFLDFLGFINLQLHSKGIERLESFLMPANFSSIVGEFMTAAIPKAYSGIVKNNYHNGHPDMLPAGMYPNDEGQHVEEGIEVKGSRHVSGWQGHNAEDVWLMVFVFDSNTSRDESQGIAPKPFRFRKVVGAELTKDDWSFSGRSATSRRTITASVKRTGKDKMEANWLYWAPGEKR